MNVRERIKALQTRLRDEAVTPQLARDALVQLTALSGNVADAVRAYEAAYRAVLAACFEAEGKANRAKVKAEASDEYKAWREAKDTQELVKQLIVTCRAFLRSIDEEARLAR